jgi:hypothetical protein
VPGRQERLDKESPGLWASFRVVGGPGVGQRDARPGMGNTPRTPRHDSALSAIWVALDAHPGDVLAWVADTAYAAIVVDCSGPTCSDDEHRAPGAGARLF